MKCTSCITASLRPVLYKPPAKVTVNGRSIMARIEQASENDLESSIRKVLEAQELKFLIADQAPHSRP